MSKPVPSPSALGDTLSRLKAVLGEGGWSQDPARLEPKLVEWRGRWRGETPLLVMPRTTGEVAAVVGICAADGVAITPQGGNTGLVAGQIPQGEILLSTEKLRAVRDVDGLDDVMVLEAGVTLSRPMRRPPGSVAASPSAWLRKAPARSAAWSRPMPAARRCCATA